ncbi:hypothetical protein RB597_010042 [Gaeumannomyces tritici]
MSGTGPPNAVPPVAGGAYAGQNPASAPSAASAAAPQAQSAPAPVTTSPSDLNKIVTDYLLKKGYTQTEATFRRESAHVSSDGRPIHRRVQDMGPNRFLQSFNMVRDWVENNLDVYKFELRKILWPLFIYSYLDLVEDGYPQDAKALLQQLKPHFESVHSDALKTLATIKLPVHVKENDMTRKYRENKYKIPLNQFVTGNLFNFLERETDTGGAVATYLLQTYCSLESTSRGPIEPYSFEAIYRRTQNVELDEADAMEGIPGVFTGANNKDALDASAPLKLGALPMEPELRDDVRAELEDEDQRNPPAPGRPTLVDEFERKIKREESVDGPSRHELPLPPSRARDVVMEMQKIRETRDRFRIEGRTGGVGIPISICMFTFHNTLGSVTSMDFSKDNQLVAAGTMDSYIRVWSLDGKPLKSKVPQEKGLLVNNRKLVGHSGPVYSVSFSDSISNIDRNLFGDDSNSNVDTGPKLLLSCSADGQVRLWSLDVWSCLCVYKAHHGPVFRVLWGPHGHYFATAGWDKTVRVFMQDHASAQRIMVGHDTGITALAWHPNGTYVFSASDEQDKSIRMWSVQTGSCVRVFTGHADYISAIEVAPNGKILASADAGGNIFFWDIAKGARIKRCRGHGKGGIPSISFSVESNVLVSGGLDGTVRLWDVELPADGSKVTAIGAAVGTSAAATTAPAASAQQDGAGGAGDTVNVGGAGERSITVGAQAAQPSNSLAPATSSGGATGGGGSGSGGGTGRKKGKEVQITPDQISAFPTKRTPVLKVQFTRMNLVVAGGCFDPER